ncbi:MAG: hypothetical protein SFV54_02200 [Bryobacteraceae bacterium]|nr:hypothetical protein [Bryobacteraceae bacterium]
MEPARLQQLLVSPQADPWFVATALGIAFFLGAAHALTPGHGKTIVAAYLVGTKGRLADAVWLGGIVTFTHTASVFALGLITLYATQHLPVERIYPWLSLTSGALVTAIGGWLLYTRLRGEHDHSHSHDHSHPHDHHHHHHHHSTGHPHSHTHHHHDHHHGAEGRGALFSLGVSGGLVPCPEALVLLMLSLTLGKIGFGLALLASFSLGLAAVLIAIGCAIVLMGPVVNRASKGGGAWRHALPVASAVVVTLLGAGLLVEAARQLL